MEMRNLIDITVFANGIETSRERYNQCDLNINLIDVDSTELMRSVTRNVDLSEIMEHLTSSYRSNQLLELIEIDDVVQFVTENGFSVKADE
jgi:hypothetical protein